MKPHFESLGLSTFPGPQVDIFTDVSEEEKRTAAAVYTNAATYICKLLDEATVFSPVLKVLLLNLELVTKSENDEFIIFLDSLS